MTKTFKATHNGQIIFFSVATDCGGCMFKIRSAAQDVADAQGWTIIKAVWM